MSGTGRYPTGTRTHQARVRRRFAAHLEEQIEDGGVRLIRGSSRVPVDKPSRSVRCGDVLTFAQGSRWLAVRIEALGERRGPAVEAQGLYSRMQDADDRPQ